MDGAGDWQGRRLEARYELRERIGRGGVGIVYRAIDTRLDRTVAIKMLRDGLADEVEALDRLQRESRAIARLVSAHIVQVFDAGLDAGRPYLVMEYLPDGTLERRVSGHLPLPIATVIDYGQQVAAGLAAVHAGGLVHRDLNLRNVLVGPDGSLKISDFGIAKATGEASLTGGLALGTAVAMAPEQVVGQPVSPATDIYALGVLLYELVTGRPPFVGESDVAVALQHLQATPLPPRGLNPTVPAWLEAIILRALAKEPAERFADGAAMSAALIGGPTRVTRTTPHRLGRLAQARRSSLGLGAQEVTRAMEVEAPTRAWPAQAPRPVRRRLRPAVWLLAGLVALLLLAGLVAAARARAFATSIAPTPSARAEATTLPAVAQPAGVPTVTVPSPTIAAATPAAIVAPTAVAAPSPTPVPPSPTVIPSPTAAPTEPPEATPTARPEPTPTAPVPSPTVAPTVTPPPQPTPPPAPTIQSKPPAVAPTATARPPLPAATAVAATPAAPPVTARPGVVELADTAFAGGYRNPGASLYADETGAQRSATWIYGGASDYPAMSADFRLEVTPRGPARLTLVGMDAEGSARMPIRVAVNGRAIYEGANPLDDWRWSQATLEVPAAALRPGDNRLTITSLSPEANFNSPPFLMLDGVRLSWEG